MGELKAWAVFADDLKAAAAQPIPAGVYGLP